MNFTDSISALAGRLEELDDFVFLDCARAGDEQGRSFLFTSPLQWLVCDEPVRAGEFLAEADRLRGEGRFLAGWFGYEFGYLLEPSLAGLTVPEHAPYALLGVFDSPMVIDSRAGDLAALDTLLHGRSGGQDRGFAVENIHTNIEKDAYLNAVNRIRKYIIAGDTYQVNFTMKLKFAFSGSPAGFYTALRRNQGVSYGAWIRRGGRDIMSFSPELFFRADRERIRVRPMKGTMKRGRTAAEDERNKQLLPQDEKNRSENVMIVDLLRNDLGRLLYDSGGGRVEPQSLFDVETYDTLLQMTSTVDGILAGGSLPGLARILPALFPCGSVTGAPKIRTMEIIRELESSPRGVYCGAIGFSGPDESVFNVPIRTVVLAGKDSEMGIGSGIVFDSDPESEWRESLLKADFLTRRQPDFQLIETLLWQPGSGYWLLDLHLERLAGSAAYFLYSFARERAVEQLEREARGFAGAMRVRLLLYRDGRVTISAAPLDSGFRPGVVPRVQDGPLPKVVFSGTVIDPDNPWLYHKTTCRALYDEERRKAVANGFFEVLFVNRKGEVTEGSISTVFALAGGRLYTPPVRCGLLPGVFRQFLAGQGKADEKIMTMDDIRQADAVFIGNSVRGLVQVALQASL